MEKSIGKQIQQLTKFVREMKWLECSIKYKGKQGYQEEIRGVLFWLWIINEFKNYVTECEGT